jgi:hypothetical protein
MVNVTRSCLVVSSMACRCAGELVSEMLRLVEEPGNIEDAMLNLAMEVPLHPRCPSGQQSLLSLAPSPSLPLSVCSSCSLSLSLSLPPSLSLSLSLSLPLSLSLSLPCTLCVSLSLSRPLSICKCEATG